jgi:hypothetical protein
MAAGLTFVMAGATTVVYRDGKMTGARPGRPLV